jgi:chromosome segregation ATPase
MKSKMKYSIDHIYFISIRFTIKLLSNNLPIKRGCEQDQSLDVKRSKLSSDSYLTLTSHLESITKLTHDMQEENERLKNEKSLLTIALNQQILKIKQVELEKSDLVQSLSKTHDLAKCLTNKFKLREDEHKKSLDELNKKTTEFELIIKTAHGALLTAKNEIQRLTNHITTLERQTQELTTKYTQSESKHLAQQNDIKQFFSALEKCPTS